MTLLSLTEIAKLIFENEDTSITAFKVDHFPVDPSYAFKIEYKDRSIVLVVTQFHWML